MSVQNQITAALRKLGGRSGAFFLVDNPGLLLEFSGRPVKMEALSREHQSFVVARVSTGMLRVRELPEDPQTGWRAAAPWGEIFTPIFFPGQVRWLAAIVLAEAEFIPSNEFAVLLVQWVELAVLRRLLHAGVREEETRREALSGFLHHDLLQRGLFLKQHLLDSGGDLNEEIGLLDESLALIQQEAEVQRPVLINQGVFFALHKLAEKLQREGLNISWRSGFQPRDHPFTQRETAAGIYFIAESLIGEARKSSQAGRIDLRLDPPAGGAHSLRLAVSYAGHPSDGFSLTLAGVFERAAYIGARTEVQQDSNGRIRFLFEV